MRAHLHDLRSEVDDQSLADSFADDWRAADLDSQTMGLMWYVHKLTKTPAACGQGDVAALRDSGWSDVAISDAVQVCSYFNYINRIANGLGVDPEDWLDATGTPQSV